MSEELRGDCRYFVTYSGVRLPFKLCQPLDEVAVNNRNTYFRAWFDEQERITGFQKMVYGEVELEHRYVYYAGGGLASAEIVDAEGEITAMHFDEMPKMNLFSKFRSTPRT